MAKTILQTVLVILILAGVFFVAISIWEKRKEAEPVAPAPETEVEAVAVRQISVVPSAEGAVLQIYEVPGPTYTITPIGQNQGFTVDVAGAKVSMLQTSIPSPHPLVKNIMASQIFAQGKIHARIRVELADNTTYQARLTGTTLFVDLRTPAEVEETPTPKAKVVAKVKPKPKKKVVRKKKPRKKVVRKRKPKPKPRPIVRSTPRPTPTPEPMPDESELSLADLGLEDTSEPAFREPEPTRPEVTEPEIGESPGGDLDLDALFADSQEGMDEPGVPPAAQIDDDLPPAVAAIPPSGTGKFDTSSIAIDSLPAVTGLSASSQGGATIVRVRREAKTRVKYFQQKGPNRVVVEFLGAQNKLRQSYGGFRGTKVTKVTTKQFMGSQGAFTRVTFYVNGLPIFEKMPGDGNDFLLKIP